MIDKSMMWIGWAAVAVVAFQATPISRLAYNPHSVEVVGSQMTMYRSFPLDWLGLPRPWLSYVETVRPMTEAHNGGQSCTARGGPFQYNREGEVGRWSIEWAADCISDPVGFHWQAKWTWHVGALRLAPVKFSQVVLTAIHTKAALGWPERMGKHHG